MTLTSAAMVVRETRGRDEPAIVIPILRLGVLARDFCRQHVRAEVAAVFERCIYLRRGDTFVCLGEPSIGNGPLTLIADFDLSGLQRGEPVSITQRCITIGDAARLTLDQCEPWRPPPWPPAMEYGRLIEVCKAIAERMVVEAPTEGLARIQARGRGQTSLARVAAPRIAHLKSWLRRALEPDPLATIRSPEAVADLIGLGPGLTPSGDDLLVGALAVLDALAERNAHAALARAITAAPRSLTSPLSHCLLRAAALGHVGEHLYCAISAIIAGDIEAAVAASRTIGHSSGWDMLAGATLTLAAVARNRSFA
jgi:Protein of unknown function (DUF2877)